MADFIQPDELFYTEFEPKLQNRFIMYVEGIPAFTIRQTSRPTVSFETVEIHHINTVRYLAGKPAWGTIDLTLTDPIVPSAAQSVMEWVRAHYESVTGAAGYAENYQKNITIKLLGPAGDIVEQWVGKNAFITEAAFGDMDWSSTSDLIDLTVSVQCDYWVLEF